MERIAEEISRGVGAVLSTNVVATHCVIVTAAAEDALREWLASAKPDLTIMSVGSTIEIFKETGSPCSVIRAIWP